MMVDQRNRANSKRLSGYRLGAGLLVGSVVLLACRFVGFGAEDETAVSVELPTAAPTRELLVTATRPIDSADIVPLGDAPSRTPSPIPSPTPVPSETPTSSPTGAVAPLEPTPPPILPPPTEPAVAIAPPPPPTPAELAPPLQGGDWDFEASYIPWANPYGEPCPGASVASGWTAFVEQGQYGSSCLNENLYAPNVFSGVKSQEITFDFIAANSGVWRTVQTTPGHRYSIKAHAKSDRSIAPVQMFIGVDLGGGSEWSASSVEWFPWQSNTQDTWGESETIVTATGNSMTIFIRGAKPAADQGGKTVIDNVSVTHLGP